MRTNNILLAIVFFVLLGILFLRKTVFKPSQRSFKEVLVQIDTSVVDQIVIHPKGLDEDKYSLSKSNGNWTAKSNGMEVPANATEVNAMLAQMTNIPTKQLISNNAERFANYEVDEESGRFVEVYSGNKLLEKFVVGRFDFNQNTRQSASYARLTESDEIYSIDGFLSMNFGKNFNSFRNKKLLNINPGEISQISIEDSQSSYVFNKDLNNDWQNEEGFVIDSSKMTSHIAKLSNVSASEFLDAFTVSQEPNISVKLGSIQSANQAYIHVYNLEDGIVVKSSDNDAYFSSDSTGVFKTIVSDFYKLFQDN